MVDVKEPLLIFDGECPVCRNLAKISEKLGIKTKPIQESSDILRKLMGEKFPFALYLIDSEGIYWGKEAAKRVLEIKGFGIFSNIAYLVYPVLSSIANRNAKEKNKGICRCMLHGKKLFKDEFTQN